MTDSPRRPGYGLPSPELQAFLSPLTPASVERIVWPGDLRLDLAAYPCVVDPPSAFVTSVRCIVRVAGRIVVCQVPEGFHVWPGGRRAPGESYAETARREVREETGWTISERDLRTLGFLHLRYVDEQPPGHPYPHPDFLQIVLTAEAPADQSAAVAGWVDVEGWEQGHRLMTPAEAARLDVNEAQQVFLRLIPA